MKICQKLNSITCHVQSRDHFKKKSGHKRIIIFVLLCKFTEIFDSNIVKVEEDCMRAVRDCS